MYYGLTFVKGTTEKNTWADWYLVPSSRPSVAAPSVKKTVIEIPGSNGVIDLTESLTGDVTYGQRTGSWEFIVMNEKPILWSELYSNIMDFLHGQRVQVYIEENPDQVHTINKTHTNNYTKGDWYYEGRIDVEAWDTQDNYSVITMNYSLDPFKYQKTATSERITLTSSYVAKTYTSYRMPVVPTFTLSQGGSATVRFKGVEYNLSVGPQAIANVVFVEGSGTTNRIEVKGSGTLTVSFRGGRL